MSVNPITWGPTVSETPEQAREKFEQFREDHKDAPMPEYKNTLYGQFRTPGEEPLSTEVGDTNQEANDTVPEDIANPKTKELPVFPVLNRLVASEQISKTSYIQIIRSLNQDPKQGLLKLQKTSDLLKIGNIERQRHNPEQNTSNLKEDHPDIKKSLDKPEKNPVEAMIYSIIGRNYIRIDTGNTEQDKQDNLTMAIEVSANEVLQDFKNIPKDKQTFKNAMLDIASSNMQRKIEGLTTLYLLAAGAAGIRGQAMEGSKRLLQKGIEFKKQKLMERFEALQIQLMKAEEDIDVDNAFLTKLHDDIARVRAEAWEIENGEVFGGGQLDTSTEGDDATRENVA